MAKETQELHALARAHSGLVPEAVEGFHAVEVLIGGPRGDERLAIGFSQFWGLGHSTYVLLCVLLDRLHPSSLGSNIDMSSRSSPEHRCHAHHLVPRIICVKLPFETEWTGKRFRAVDRGW
jgi:hypothetical protein